MVAPMGEAVGTHSAARAEELVGDQRFGPPIAYDLARMFASFSTQSSTCRRRDHFRGEFLSALEILQRGDVAPERLIGSWAGAFGPTQFMPSSFQRYGRSFCWHQLLTGLQGACPTSITL